MTVKNSVVVGVDGSHHSDTALAWAADEASARNCHLLVAHAIDPTALGLWTTTRSIRAGIRDEMQPIVDRAVATARRRHPDLVVTGRVLIGTPTRMLLLLSENAGMVVVGREGRGALSRMWLGSVTRRVLAHGRCPVVAVGNRKSTSARHIRRVVAGLAQDEVDATVLEFAFELAAARNLPLLAVHAVHQPIGLVLPSETPPTPGEVVAHAEERQLKELVEWESRYPSVRVTAVARSGHPHEVLAAACSSRDLLVLGHHQHAPYSPRQLGSSAAATLKAATCSVAVVHTDLEHDHPVV